MKAWRTLWPWGAMVLALHLLVLLNLPSRQSMPPMAPAMAHTFTTRAVTLPAPSTQTAAAAVPVLASVPVPVPAPAPAVQSKAPAARPAPRRTPEPRTAALPAVTAPTAAPPAQGNAGTPGAPEAVAASGLEALAGSSGDLPVPDLSADPAVPAQKQPAQLDHSAPLASGGADSDAGTAANAAVVPEAAALAADTAPTPAAPPPQAPDKPEARPNALAIFAPGAEQPLAGPAPAVQLPAPQRLKFDVTGQAKNFQYSAHAELVWQHDGQRYQARQELSILLLGARLQTSSGTLGPAGLQPERFGDRARSEKAAHFNYAQQRITFSANTPDAPLAAGTQDRLSVFVQLGALLAAAPERYPPGTRIRLDTAGTRDVDTWTFTVEGEETLELPVGSVRTLQLQRLPRPGHDHDQKAQLWLAPTLGYLPARIRLTQASGDFADLRLSSHAAP